jgi:Cdc6-like AAA superfamily ATPase
MSDAVFSADRPSEDEAVLSRCFVDPSEQYHYLDRFYLSSFLAQGGSKLKLIIGRDGSGKTHLMRRVLARAQELGYLASATTAKDSPLYSFQEIYRQVLSAADIWSLVDSYATSLVQSLGYSYRVGDGNGAGFVSWAAGQGRDVSHVRRELRDQLHRDLVRDRNLDKTFVTALVTMTAHRLGAADYSPEQARIVADWICGRPVTARERAIVHLYRTVDRYSSRLMLRSFLRFLPRAGYRGVVFAVDDLDWVTGSRQQGGVRYTKMRRDDLYESLRQVIDEVETLPGLFMVLAGRREVLEDASRGIPSYAALWMRLQNEVRPSRANRFADLVDLDCLWTQAGQGAISEIAERIMTELNTRAEARKSVISKVCQLDPGGRVSPVRRAVDLTLSATGR